MITRKSNEETISRGLINVSNTANRSGKKCGSMTKLRSLGGVLRGQWVDQSLFWIMLSAVRNGVERGGEGLTHNRRTFSLPCVEL